MPGIEHPKGPQYGRIYSTPEEALSADEAGIVVPLEDFRDILEDLQAAALLEEVETADLHAITPEEFAERFGQPGEAA